MAPFEQMAAHLPQPEQRFMNAGFILPLAFFAKGLPVVKTSNTPEGHISRHFRHPRA